MAFSEHTLRKFFSTLERERRNGNPVYRITALREALAPPVVIQNEPFEKPRKKIKVVRKSNAKQFGKNKKRSRKK